jgi:hypothetical protein
MDIYLRAHKLADTQPDSALLESITRALGEGGAIGAKG